jgi:hypothetical protein
MVGVGTRVGVDVKTGSAGRGVKVEVAEASVAGACVAGTKSGKLHASINIVARTAIINLCVFILPSSVHDYAVQSCLRQ